MFEKKICARFATKRNVASDGLEALLPGVINQQLRVAVTTGMSRSSTSQNLFAKFSLFICRGFCTHSTNLAIVPLSFALSHEDVTLRLVRMRDWRTIEKIQLSNRDWFRQWEATNPTGPLNLDFRGSVRSLLRQLADESALPFAIEYRGQLVGQLNVSNILHGSVSTAFIGYWIDPEFAGFGITPLAVALATDYAFNVVGLHRIEIAIRPENRASIQVVRKLGFRYEGTKLAFIHINNAWRDHHIFALTFNEVRNGLLSRYLREGATSLSYPFD